MVRLCTHCKKEDTGYVKFKYCPECFQKCMEWLEQKALEKPEPESLVPAKKKYNSNKGDSQ
jgi:hypothetical protein